MSAHPLDGKYRVTSTSSGKDYMEKRSDGETEIRDGKTSRIDEAKCKWTSEFTVLNNQQVKMVSVADASKAAVDFLLTAPDGTPSRGPVTYEAILKLSRKNDKIQISGQIDYGNDMIFLTLRKIGA